jgi:hypothetical protein
VSPEELRDQSDMELRRLVDDIRIEDLDLKTLYGFVVFDHIFNPLVLSTGITMGRKLAAAQKVDDFVAACSTFVGLSENALSTLISALNNAATTTGNIDFAKRSVAILDQKRLEPSFHATYLRAYALIECVELAPEAERSHYVREAKKQILQLRTAGTSSSIESNKRIVESMSAKLETALAPVR